MDVARLVAALLTAVLLPVVGQPAPTLEPLPAVPDPARLEARCAASRAAVLAAGATAASTGARERVAALAALARPERQLLAFDPTGGGRAVEVIGDLATARHVAVVVPGADTRLETFDTHGSRPWAAPAGGARALAAAARRIDPDTRLGVVAWLGYDTPENLTAEVLTAGRATAAVPALRDLVRGLARDDVTVSLLCHSYGAVVCANAIPGLRLADVVLYGSPGAGVDRVDRLDTDARVWAGRGSRDWTRYVPEVRLDLLAVELGFGADPADPDFGARPFRAGASDHSDYLRPGSPSLGHLAAIAVGAVQEVGR